MKNTKELNKKLESTNKRIKALKNNNKKLKEVISTYIDKHSDLQLEDFQLLGNIILLLSNNKQKLALKYIKEIYEKRKHELIPKSEAEIYFSELQDLYKKRELFEKLKSSK
ncbi:MAG: hypothetical protein IJH12_07025 [Clostridia bacterium]|nr:hypothetical protein [Clostridia bacterium]